MDENDSCIDDIRYKRKWILLIWFHKMRWRTNFFFYHIHQCDWWMLSALMCACVHMETRAFCMRNRRSIIASVLDRMENKLCDTAGHWSKVSHGVFVCMRFTGCSFAALLRAMFPPSSTYWRMCRMLLTLLQLRDTETFSRKNKIEKL